MALPQTGVAVNTNSVPSFDDLPFREGDPPYSAWGLYGDKDELGTLNRLTNERVASAARSEIKTGERISLNWPLNAQSKEAFFKRSLFHQDLIRKGDRTVHDDVWTFNTQCSSQWDGLRHYGYQKEKKFYNGVTMDDVHVEGATENGIQAWSEKGIVGRGVLVDFHTWRLQQGIEYDPFTSTSISVSHLEACLDAQGTTLQFGDILIIRSGWILTHASKTAPELAAARDVYPHHFGGLEQSTDMLRFLWDHVSAVAGDQPSLEVWPTQTDWMLHEVLLGGWGCPIGELFDLEKLAARCRAEGRYSFFVASEPCNVPGGVASPPNILAIF